MRRLYGGLLLGWTWPVASALVRLRMGWYLWLASVGIAATMAVWAIGMFMAPSALDVFETTMFVGVGLPFFYILAVFMTAPLAARARWAEQQLILNWARGRQGTVRKRTEYWDFASTEWESSAEVAGRAPILANGNAIGFPTVVAVGRTVVGRAVLGFRSAVARTGRSRGSRDVILFAFVPVCLPADFAISKLCCWRRSMSTAAQAHLHERLREESFESIQLDGRLRIGAAAQDDRLLIRQLMDPVVVDRFASSDTVWEVTGGGVTAYRSTRATEVSHLEELAQDVEFLANRLTALAKATHAAAS